VRAPGGAILLPVMADGAWRGISRSMLVHFAAAKRKVAWHLSRVAPRPGTGEQDVRKTALCIDRARSIHTLIPVPGPARNSLVGYCAEGRGGPDAETESSQGV